ncbi:MAG: zinc ribbon domain-containing protein [Chloroflexi bacterium]|nr:zinc ribbon domain-containing protein [Chloroflexota bacterium]
MYQATAPCPKCGTQNLHGTWICTHCGNTLLIYCPHCRAGNVSGSKFCQSCGLPLSGQAQPVAQPAQPYPQNQPPGYQQPAYGPYDYQQYPGGYPPPPFQPAPQGGGDIISQAQAYFDSFIGKLKEIVSTTNPILLSAMVVLVVGMTVFLVLAFQLGWIKTATETKTITTKNTTPPVISLAQVKPGDNKGAIIYWVTDKPSSSQVQYGIWPNFTTMTAIQTDPTTGANAGVLIHEVGLTSLTARSTYIYRCISIDKDGNKAISPDLQFQTAQ